MKLFELFCVFGLALAVFLSIGTNQLSPHLVTVSLGGKVMSSQWVTNPAYVTFQYETKATSNGLQVLTFPVTNYYWQQWEIFK